MSRGTGGKSGRARLSWLSAVRDGRSHQITRQGLRDLKTPVLFVQGTRDSLCPLDLLESVRAEMKAHNVLQVVEGGDHSLIVNRRQLQAATETQEDVDQRILTAIAKFIALL